MDNNQTNIQPTEKKKSNVGLIIIIIIVILLLLFAVWYFLLRDKGTNEKGNGGSNNTQQTEKDDKTPPQTNPTEKREYDYTIGVLNQIVDEEGKPEQTALVINGMIMVGRSHIYNGNSDFDENVEYFVKQGYKKIGINASFYPGELFDIYLDSTYTGSNNDLKFFIATHRNIEDYSEIDVNNLEKYALGGAIHEFETLDKSDNYWLSELSTSTSDELGKYDLIFVYKGKIAYFVVFELTANPNE